MRTALGQTRLESMALVLDLGVGGGGLEVASDKLLGKWVGRTGKEG